MPAVSPKVAVVLEYRIAESRDAPLIAALHAENWRRTYCGNFRDEFLDGDVFADRQAVWNVRFAQPAPNQYAGVAIDGATLVGFVCVYGAHDPEWGSLVDNLHVKVNMQRRGIGSALMKRAGEWLSSTFPEEGVYLLVWQSNPAKAFYERLGGRSAEVLDVENPGGGVGRYLRFVWDRPDQLWPMV